MRVFVREFAANCNSRWVKVGMLESDACKNRGTLTKKSCNMMFQILNDFSIFFIALKKFKNKFIYVK